MVSLPSPDFVPAEARALAEAFALQPQWDGVGGVPFQVSLALHAIAENLGCTVGVALGVVCWASPGFPGRCLHELDAWINSGELAREIAAGHLEVAEFERMVDTAVPPGAV